MGITQVNKTDITFMKQGEGEGRATRLETRSKGHGEVYGEVIDGL